MPSQLDVDKIRHTNGTDALTFDTSGNTNLKSAVIEGSSSGDLVRITQTGSGNALVVEDSANPDSTPFVVDSSGNVGIGTSNPQYKFHIRGADATSNFVVGSTVENTQLEVLTYQDSRVVLRSNDNGNGRHLTFETGTTEVMRIDSGGHVLVGTTSLTVAGLASAGNGVRFSPSGIVAQFASNAIATAAFNRTSDDGTIIDLRKDGTTVGGIGTIASKLTIGSANTGVRFNYAGIDTIAPWNVSTNAVTNGATSLGYSNALFDDIYASNNQIQGSDRNMKQDIEELTEAEQRVAVAAKSLLRKFRWKSAVAKKGDDARIHFGIIAQDLQAAFEAEGLDAGRYGMFISTTWWETSETYTDDEGIEQTRTITYNTAEEAPEGAVERTRLGVRYSELLAFIIAAI